MGKTDSALPFPRGESFYNGDTTRMASDLARDGYYGGFNLEGKEYVFELNQPDDTNQTFLDGRSVRVRCVRNLSTVNMKPGRLVRSKAVAPFGCQTDGYCSVLADSPLGVVDEFLPAAGVANGDLFYVVVDGPSKFVNQASAITTAIGSKLVPAVTGSGPTDDLAGRVALQDLTGATATLGNNIQNCVGWAEVVDAGNNDLFAGVVSRGYKF